MGSGREVGDFTSDQRFVVITPSNRANAVTIYAAEGVVETVVPNTVDVALIRSRGKNSHTRMSAYTKESAAISRL